MLPEAAHAREVVLELCELHLELALGRHRVLREDVEDQLRAVDDAQAERVLEPSLLPGLEVVVDDQRLGAGLPDGPSAPRACPCRRRCADRAPAALDELADGLDTGRPEQLAHLPELLVARRPLGQHRDEEAALGLSPRRGVRLVWRHTLGLCRRLDAKRGRDSARRLLQPLVRHR